MLVIKKKNIILKFAFFSCILCIVLLIVIKVMSEWIEYIKFSEVTSPTILMSKDEFIRNTKEVFDFSWCAGDVYNNRLSEKYEIIDCEYFKHPKKQTDWTNQISEVRFYSLDSQFVSRNDEFLKTLCSISNSYYPAFVLYGDNWILFGGYNAVKSVYSVTGGTMLRMSKHPVMSDEICSPLNKVKKEVLP